MRILPTVIAAVATLVIPGAGHADSTCTARSLAGSWVVAGEDTRCIVQINRNGSFTGDCTEDDDDTFGVRGRISIDRQCVLRISAGEVRIGEGRAWSTSSATRLDAFVGMIRWDDDDLEMIAGYRRPSDGLPLD
ncbi:MAG: hypothetical protein KJZ85_01065 [Rhodobacteraceae bacterium]|jgi:hypothetical protein|nr:hypothetical protein [Paracoccaceae bacterium]